MVFQVELAKCRWTMQGLDMTHLWPAPDMRVTEGPLLVSLMNDGNHFVHDGRHRAIRALLRGETLHDAEWLEDQAAKEIETMDRIVDGLPVPRPSCPRYTYTSAIATCGKYHVHDAHAFGEHMEEDCDGIPK